MKKLFLIIAILLFQTSVAKMVDTFEFHSEQERARAVALAKSLRCPQCQNQNLVESNADIAYNLRIEVYNLVNQGKSDDEIIQIMTQRFGDFVLYKPPFKYTTLLLWGLPIALLLLAIGFLLFQVFRKSKQDITPTSPITTAQASLVTHLPSNKQGSLWVYMGLFCGIVLISSVLYFCLDRYNIAEQETDKFIQQKATLIRNTPLQTKQHYIKTIENALRQNPNDSQKWIELGQAYSSLNQFDDAMITYSYAEKLEGTKAYILGLMATTLYYKHHNKITPEVATLIEQALQLDPNELSSLSLLANDYFIKKDYPQALELWQKLLDSNHSNLDRKAVIERMKTAEFLLGKAR
ncbi:Cytochrome c-type biogenesis protein CcmH precursor [Phocoenobacter uteri]|uniref:Formate-dependent nitrite reductase complex subunit n=1 Tax=Phocoenobacter uteri TaxID=146806 RepID=A0A379C9A9_9PAST|nr:heme lyase NrfEFG subunit NrfF [Phocoenobacter uteri]MDG6882181.1 hypothetical protein [Phocoenobacter uteri]SUB58335.1 Cytochrome c-type biogenesis protein CcmH precursor [Phocoenobacter uteri]